MRVAEDTVLGDRYRLDRPLAAGGMGEVWHGTDTVLGRQVAVKVLHSDLAARPGFHERFRREAQNLAMLSHPAIATLFDYGEQDESPYLVMELVVGQTLARRLAHGSPMPVDQVIDVFEQIAAGLAVAHQAGMVHRDIKPANLMLTENGRVKITDFGISRLVDSVALTAASDVLGTPQYMSPEQITGLPASPSSDVYSLGVVAHEMLTGHPPFVADTPVAVAMAQLHDLPPPFPPGVPRDFAELVARTLTKDPAGRPSDGAALLAELDQLPDLGASATVEASAGDQPVAPARTDVPQRTDDHDQSTPTEVLGAPTVANPPDPSVVPTAAMAAAFATTVAPSAPRSPAEPLLRPMHRHRTKRRVSMAAVALVAVALVWVIAASARSDESSGDLPTSPSAATVAGPVTSDVPSTVASTPATVAPETTSTMMIDPAQYVGRDRGAVVDELRELGFTVNERRVDVDRGTKKNTVVAVEPNGPVPAGSAIEVQVAAPQKGNGDD